MWPGNYKRAFFHSFVVNLGLGVILSPVGNQGRGFSLGPLFAGRLGSLCAPVRKTGANVYVDKAVLLLYSIHGSAERVFVSLYAAANPP